MFDEQSFEWMFVVPEISGPDDPRVDELGDRGEVFVESHNGLNLVSTLTSGRTAVGAARIAINLLADCKLKAQRTYPDLVTRADIAERVGMRRQAVDNWVRGDRQQGFPSPAHLVGGGAWLWRDVSDWLQRERIKGLPDDGGVLYPTLADHAVIDGELASQQRHFRIAQGAMPMVGSLLEYDFASASLDVRLTPPAIPEGFDAGFVRRLIENLDATSRWFGEPRDADQGSNNPCDIAAMA